MRNESSQPSRRIPAIALIVALVVTLTSASGVALAQSSGPESGAAPPAAAVQADSGSNNSSSDQGLRSNLGGLPFTGLDLMILGGLAMVLVGTGMALRRLSAPRVPRL